jgi:hypothetical protein
MGVLARLRRLVTGVADDAPDDREMVYLATAPLYEASMLTATLRAKGVDARYVETTNPLTRSLTDGKIFVPRGQLVRAEAVMSTDDDIAPGDDARSDDHPDDQA